MTAIIVILAIVLSLAIALVISLVSRKNETTITQEVMSDGEREKIKQDVESIGTDSLADVANDELFGTHGK